jgi:hypothetical protein
VSIRLIPGLHAKRKFHFYMGYSPLIDEGWDDLYVPALTLATKYIQYEGEGRNNFGPEIATKRRPLRAVCFKPYISAPAIVVAPAAPAIVRPTPDMQPLHAFCFGCGWRMGGPDSYNGLFCKCGLASEPLIGRGGSPFFS